MKNIFIISGLAIALISCGGATRPKAYQEITLDLDQYHAQNDDSNSSKDSTDDQKNKEALKSSDKTTAEETQDATTPKTDPSKDTDSTKKQTETSELTTETQTDNKADNTEMNKRDRDSDTLTPGKTSNDQNDLNISVTIRKSLMSDDVLSSNAKNIKIIANDGVVTLRGVVNSADEKSAIESKVKGISGVKRVNNQLDIKNSINKV